MVGLRDPRGFLEGLGGRFWGNVGPGGWGWEVLGSSLEVWESQGGGCRFLGGA